MFAYLAAIAAVASTASAQFLGFDDFTGPVTDQYADQYADLAIFSSDPSAHCDALLNADSAPNALMSALDTGEITGAENIYIDFTNPICCLTFSAIDADLPGVAARFVVWDFHTVTVADFISTGDPIQRIDLSMYPVITRLEIIDITRVPAEAGIAWDSFEFMIVPAPATLALIGCTASCIRRRR